MSDNTPYASNRPLRRLLVDNPELLMTLSRFDIPLGFGEKKVSDVCAECGVDTCTFLSVCNIVSGKTPSGGDDVSLPCLVRYLKKSHLYFLDFILPRIRVKLIEALSSNATGNLPVLIMRFFDEFVEEVRIHLDGEEDVFTWVEKALEGNAAQVLSIDDFSSTHQSMDAKLRDLKEIFICHFHPEEQSSPDLVNSVLLDIVLCERDIARHAEIEDRLFIPAVRKMLEELEAGSGPEGVEEADGDNELTNREKEIVEAIAMGLSNKQIADRLFVSVHTVTTHRRNICSKLDIHSSAGLTLYAVIHGLVRIDSISQSPDSK